LITVLRSIRADFAPEIWAALGTKADAGVFTRSETLVALGVIAANGLAVLVRDNRRAFFLALRTALAGLLLIILALVGLEAGRLTAFAFMVVLGLGLYLPYVAVHTTVFERLIAMTRDRGNIGYLLYLADAFGYLGYVAVMAVRNFAGIRGDFLAFFRATCWTATLAALGALLLAWWFFAVHRALREPVPAAAQSDT
jgi:hypothetical protein